MHRPSLYTVCGDDTLQLHLRASFNASNVSDIKTYEAMEINCSAVPVHRENLINLPQWAQQML